MSDRAATVLAQRLHDYAPEMFDFLLTVHENCRDGESGRYVLNYSEINKLDALVLMITHGLEV